MPIDTMALVDGEYSISSGFEWRPGKMVVMFVVVWRFSDTTAWRIEYESLIEQVADTNMIECVVLRLSSNPASHN